MDICRNAGGELTQFLSRKEQEELISIIKTSTDYFFIETVFIHLEAVNGSVFSFQILFQFWPDLSMTSSRVIIPEDVTQDQFAAYIPCVDLRKLKKKFE